MGQRSVVWNGYSYQAVDEADIGGGWDDIQGPITQAGGISSLTFEAFADTGWQTYFFRNNQDDRLHLLWQMSHSWDKSQVHPHIHIIPMVAPASNEVVRFTGAYAWSKVGVQTTLNVGWTTFTSDFVVTPAMERIERISPLIYVDPPPNASESDVLMMWVQRSGTDPGDTYKTAKVGGTAQANLCVLSIDCHYYKEKGGTIIEFPGAGT